MDVKPQFAFCDDQRTKEKNMKKIRLEMSGLGFCLAGLLAVPTAQADFVFGYAGVTVNQGGGYILGDNFTVNRPITVGQLGVFDQDSMAGGYSSIPIAIFEHNGSDPANGWTVVNGTSTFIGSGAHMDVADQTSYVNITPVTLGPGLYSVVTLTGSDYNSYFGGGAPSEVGFNNLGGAVTDGTYNIWNYAPSGGLGATLSGMNQNVGATFPSFGAGTFSAVPEATTLISGSLMLLPFGVSAMRILRKKIAG